MALFAGKVVWITGAGTGIGRAAALMFAGEGATVALWAGGGRSWTRSPAAIAASGGGPSWPRSTWATAERWTGRLSASSPSSGASTSWSTTPGSTSRGRAGGWRT